MSEETKQPTGEEMPETQAGAEQEAPQTEAPEKEKEEKNAKAKKKKEKLRIDTDFIRLDSALKFANAVSSGGEAKTPDNSGCGT